MATLVSTKYGFTHNTGAHDPRPESCSTYLTVRDGKRRQRRKQAQETCPRKDWNEISVKLAPVEDPVLSTSPVGWIVCTEGYFHLGVPTPF